MPLEPEEAVLASFAWLEPEKGDKPAIHGHPTMERELQLVPQLALNGSGLCFVLHPEG